MPLRSLLVLAMYASAQTNPFRAATRFAKAVFWRCVTHSRHGLEALKRIRRPLRCVAQRQGYRRVLR